VDLPHECQRFRVTNFAPHFGQVQSGPGCPMAIRDS